MFERRFSSEQIQRILDQSMIHMCACPAQICKQLSGVRGLYQYQAKCLNLTETDTAVHEEIARAAQAAYLALEACLAQVLSLEGWNMETLEMPAHLQKRMLDE